MSKPIKQSKPLKAGRTHVDRSTGERVRHGVTPGGRAYVSRQTAGGAYRTTVVSGGGTFRKETSGYKSHKYNAGISVERGPRTANHEIKDAMLGSGSPGQYKSAKRPKAKK